MKVKLVGYTQPTEDFTEEGMGNVQDLISYCARVSNPSNQMNMETTEKLLKYLVKHKHWSPFEMASATLEITTTRDIARQILRHRSFSFQEFSQRYADPTGMDFVYREARLQDAKNRQNSIDLDDSETSKGLKVAWFKKQRDVVNQALEAYKWAVENGIAKEQARCVLPEGNTPSVMYMSGTIRSWIHYLELRTGVETQKEHREVAIAIAKAIKTIFPLAETYLGE